MQKYLAACAYATILKSQQCVFPKEKLHHMAGEVYYEADLEKSNNNLGDKVGNNDESLNTLLINQLLHFSSNKNKTNYAFPDICL